MTDSQGITTDFRNTIIIATSNAGALFIRDAVRNNAYSSKDEFKKHLIDAILEQHIFSPEFVNRFDDVIVFHPLSPAEAREVALLMMNEIIDDLREKKGVMLRIPDEVLEAIAKRGYSQEIRCT